MPKIYRPGMTLEELARLAKARYSAKESVAKENYNAVKDDMISAYNALPFGELKKRHYAERIRVATLRFDADKWEREWKREMSR